MTNSNKVVCKICGKKVNTERGLAMHMAWKHTNAMNEGKKIMNQPYQKTDFVKDRFNNIDFENRLEHIEGKLGLVSPSYYQSPYPYPQQKQNDPNKLFNQMQMMLQMQMIQEQLQQNRIQNAILVKSLSKGDSSDIERLMKLDSLINSRYGDSGSDDLSGLLSLLMGAGKKKQSLKNETQPINVLSSNTSPQSLTSKGSNMRLPKEKEILNLDTEQTISLIESNPFILNAVKAKNIDCKTAFKNVKHFYPNYPEEKFIDVWNGLMGKQ